MVTSLTLCFDLDLLTQRRPDICGLGLSPSLPPSQRFVTLGAVLANISLAIEDNNVLTAHDTHPRLNVDIETDVRPRFRLLLSRPRWLENTT